MEQVQRCQPIRAQLRHLSMIRSSWLRGLQRPLRPITTSFKLDLPLFQSLGGNAAALLGGRPAYWNQRM
jgi:hypothetical protein